MVSTTPFTNQNNIFDESNRPSSNGRFGNYGGQYVPETLMPALFELEKAAKDAWTDKKFTDELNHLLKNYMSI